MSGSRSKPDKLAEQWAADALDWAAGVADGSIVAGKYVRLAVERQQHDLEHGIERGLLFDEEQALRALEWYSFCSHYQGEFAGKMFVPAPWQGWLTWLTHGWVFSETGYRRFRERYIEVARGNGKTSWLAADALRHLVADDEPGAAVYAAATKRDQAALLWGAAAHMVEASPELAKRIKIQDSAYYRRLTFENSIFEPLSSDSKTLDGLQPQAVAIDELHEHKTRMVYDKLRTALTKRRQPLLTAITTASDDSPETIYEELHTYAVDVAEGWETGAYTDDRFLSFVAAIDDDDDPHDEAAWAKANPSLGICVRQDDLRDLSAKAQKSPTFEPTFLRMHCNRRAASTAQAIRLEDWDACRAPIDWESFRGTDCIGALDLSSSRDLTALSLYFQRDGLHWYRWFAWLPEDNIDEASKRDRVPYELWARQGWLELTPGNQVDELFVAERIKTLSENHNVLEWSFDPWHAVTLQNVVQRETSIVMVKFLQDLKSFGEPTMRFLDELESHKMRHDGNPLARWCASNVVTKEDSHGNRKPHKKASIKRIDPIVAAMMARGRAIARESNVEPPPPKLGFIAA